jgi:predicted P-loop ATPase
LLDVALTEDSLEEQFRSELSEVEYGVGNATKEHNVELAMENDEVYKKVQMIVQRTRQTLSRRNTYYSK